MDKIAKRKLVLVSLVYWFLLAYIIGALLWWLILLQKQNQQMQELRINQLNTRFANSPESAAHQAAQLQVRDEHQRNTTKYLLEGTTFLALILFCAVFVYRAVRRQLRIQQQQQNFMMAITHELKTPIAITQLNLETLQKHQLDESKRQKLIQITLEETNRLNTLTNNILVSSQLEGGRYHFTKEELSLSDLFRNCINDFMRRYPERNWELDVPDEIDLNGDALLLTILINNLLENALKYSSRQQVIACSLHQKQQEILLKVSDNGIGIPDSEKKKVFDKFYRIGNEATRTTKGTGLGLYLCSKIARDHNADIYVTDNQPAGSTFVVSFKPG